MLELVPFEPRYADEILTWALDARELAFWAALEERPDAAIFTRWHADEDVSAFVLVKDDTPVAYGELWTEPEERSVELARVLVSPGRRRRGAASRLLELLMERAAFDAIWVRVVPDNEPALGCYEALGFVRAAEAEQRRLNDPQPRTYVWLSRAR